MAMAYPLETPDRLLKRVQQLEDMELPSLPSFQHDDIDYDSMSNAESSRDDHHSQQHQQHQQQYQYHQSMDSSMNSQDDMATPHPLRQAIGPPPSSTLTGGTTRSPADSSSTASGSPFPPITRSPREQTPSPYAPTAALTSTPLSRMSRSTSRSLAQSTTIDQTATTSRFSRHERTRSGTGSIGNSTHASRKDRWQTPGEMSGSFSGGEEIVDEEQLGPERSVPLNDHSEQYEDSYSQSLPELPSLTAAPEETPITRRLSSAHVILDRPKRRTTSIANNQLESIPASPSEPLTPLDNKAGDTQASTAPSVPVPQDRIPSLTRSEVSVADTNGVATTPEGPIRNVSMMTPRSDVHQEYEITGEYEYEVESQTDEDRGDNPTLEYRHETEYTAQDHGQESEYYPSPMKSRDIQSPAKQATTSSLNQFTTPGTIRGQALHNDSYDSIAHPSTVLHDVTDSIQNTPSSGPYTPTPIGHATKSTDPSTPRAPLNDAERRRSHVLAVLSASGPQSRVLRPTVKGTPHPLRRVSTAPDTESIAEEDSDLALSRRSIRFAGTPSGISRITDQSGNESFVSVASSADLTSDKRASHMHSRLSRGNTSFPTILLPTHPSSSPGGGSLKGLSDHRADGIKIHKHLNAMNKQLLETNADLAREAEAWRDEADRLRNILQENGIEVAEVDVMAGIDINIEQSTSANLSQQLPEWPTASPNGRDSSKGDHSQLISQLSSLSARHQDTPNGKSSTSAQDLLEGLSPEEHAAVMQEMAERLEDLEEGLNEKDQLIADLHQQLEEAKLSGSSEDHSLRDRVNELSVQLQEAERARGELHADFSQKTEQHAKRFGEICSGFEEQVKSLEKELSSSRAEADRLRTDRSGLDKSTTGFPASGSQVTLRKRVQELQVEIQVANEQSTKRISEVETLKQHSAQLLHEKAALMHRVEDAEAEVDELKDRVAELEANPVNSASEDMEAMKAELRAACEAQRAAEDDIAQIDQEMAEHRQTASDQEAELERQRGEIDELNKVISDLEADLAAAQNSSRINEGAEEGLRAVQQELQDVNDRLADKESEVEMLKGKLEVANIATQSIRTSQRRSTSPASTASAVTKMAGQFDLSSNHQDSFVAAMEERLDEAYREIGRLKHELGASPSRKSAIEVRDARIQALEREKASLADRLASVRSSSTISTPVPPGVQEAGSPFKRMTPFVHKAIASLKTPRTPGPMAELSWLQTTIGDSNEPVLQAQLDFLQTELNDANHQLDSNFSRLESAGLGAIALAEKLAEAEERINELEDEIRTLVQKNKASLALVSAQREERERDTEGRMQKALEAVHDQMEQLKSDIAAERTRLRKDNGRLQDLASEMRLKSQAQIDSFRAEIERMAQGAEEDLKVAQIGLNRVQREKEDWKKIVETSKNKIAQLERDLANERQAYDSLSRRNAQATQPAASRAELAQKDELIRSIQSSLEDAQMEKEKLEVSLSQLTQSLIESEATVNRYHRERETVLRELGEFERDLEVQKSESRAFGQQLLALKKEQNGTTEKHQAELRSLEMVLRNARDMENRTAGQLNVIQNRYEQLEKWRQDHHCDPGLSQALADQKVRFKTQSRELASQIRYLKAKYTRESTFRNGLALQKRYLLLLVGGMSLDQQATLRAIAQMGFPVPQPVRKNRSLKSVGMAVLAIVRARNTAQRWRAEVELKSIAVMAHGERRRVSART